MLALLIQCVKLFTKLWRNKMTDLDFALSIKGGDIKESLSKVDDYSLLYKFSPLLGNFLTVVDFQAADSVLEISSSYGITQYYLNRVTNIEKKMNEEQEKINHILYDNKVKKYNGKGSFDKIIVEATSELPNLLTDLLKVLKKDGQIILVSNNSYSISSLSGKPNVKNEFFGSLEDSSCYSRKGLIDIFEQLNLKSYFYYPLPDRYFANEIFSDEFLPNMGDIRNIKTYYGKERVVLFDEEKALERIIKSGEFQTFAPAFVVKLVR